MFYDVGVEKIILEAWGEFSTRIWFSPVSTYTYGFYGIRIKEQISGHCHIF